MSVVTKDVLYTWGVEFCVKTLRKVLQEVFQGPLDVTSGSRRRPLGVTRNVTGTEDDTERGQRVRDPSEGCI